MGPIPFRRPRQLTLLIGMTMSAAFTVSCGTQPIPASTAAVTVTDVPPSITVSRGNQTWHDPFLVLHLGDTVSVSLLKKGTLPWEPLKADPALLLTLSSSDSNGSLVATYKTKAYGVADLRTRFPCGPGACAALGLSIYVFIVDTSTPPIPVSSAAATFVIPTTGPPTLLTKGAVIGRDYVGVTSEVTLRIGQALAIVALNRSDAAGSTSNAQVLSMVSSSHSGATTIMMFQAGAPGSASVTGVPCPPGFCSVRGLILQVEVS
jgi:hypothetical protein